MLQKLKFQPGFNKQVTATGGEGQWVRSTALHHFVNASGIKYAAIGTNRMLYVFSGGAFYDITPLKSTTTLTSAFSTTNGDATVTITFSSDHNITKGDIILLDN